MRTLRAYLESLPPVTPHATLDPLAGTALPGTSLWEQARATGLVWRAAALVACHLVATALLLASWVFVGSGALNGRLDRGWLAAWALALLSTIPLRAAARWLQGVLTIGLGGLLKQRLLAGALAVDPEWVRTRGAGGLMAEVLEADTVDGVGLSGGLETVLVVLELLVLPFVFVWGAAPAMQLVVLAGWLVLSLALIARNTRARATWTALRLRLSQSLIENMAAHRTRLVQQPPSGWHRAEDGEMESYAAASEALDRSTARIQAALPRGYVVIAFAVLAPTFVSGSATLAQLAVTLGAILFAAAALERLGFGFSRAAAAWIAWRMASPLCAAAPASAPVSYAAAGHGAAVALEAHGLVFHHPDRTEPVLHGCSLAIRRGEMLLLQGESGSGKSTLTSLLAGLRQPTAGFIVADGLDRQTLGASEWRRRVAAAPQDHENHILSAPLGFNLLLGRPHPHTARDYDDARQVCHELGLDELLERMPAGLDQMVGETGWRLSHGERSRVFLARALLQNADVVLLDESFATLDPENLRQCLECVMRRAPALLVVAHP